MFSIRVLLLTLACCFAALPSVAQENLIAIGKHKAHPTRIIGKYKDVATIQSSVSTLRALGLSIHRHYSLVPGMVVMDVSGVAQQTASAGNPGVELNQLLTRIAALRDSGLFEYVQPDYAHTHGLSPSDTRFQDGTLWGLSNTGQDGGKIGADIQAVQAWDITTGSSNVVVAVIDTGIRYTHRDLASQMWRNPDETPGNGIDDDGNGFVDDIFGINSIVDNGNPLDDHGHGSHVAGTIGAAANNGFPHVGVNWNVQLMGLKFIRSEAQGGFGLTSDAIQCLQYAVQKGAKISNNSWGGGPFESAMRDAIAAARAQGHLFVAAAGNSGLDNDLDPHFPSSYDLDNIISVAALDRKDTLAFFSNFGKTSVDLGAPGVEIFSCWSDSDTDYVIIDGTSMASPHVAGVAALCLAKYPASTMEELRERLLSTTVPVDALNGKSVTGGRVNAFRALLAVADGNLEISVDPPDGSDLPAGVQIPVFVRVNDLLAITNATITNVTINGAPTTNLVFLNDGNPPDVVTNDHIHSALFNVPTNTGPLVLGFVVSAPGKNNSTNSINYNVVAGPDNDDFLNATKIPNVGGIVRGNNKFATIEFGEPLHAQVPTVASSVWWNWSPNNTTNVVVDTIGSAFDTVLAVYTGNSLGSLKQIAAVNDVTNRNQGYVTFTATNGVTYHIVVAGVDTNETGVVRLRVEPGGQPDLAPPIVVIANPPSGIGLATNQTLIAGTASDPVPSASGVSDVFVQVNDEPAVRADGTNNWSQTVNLREGQNTIRVFGVDFAGNSSSPTPVTVYYLPQDPANDILANAIALVGNQGTATANNVRATKEAGEPFHGGNQGGKSVWWSWQAPADGVLTLSTTNSSFDTLLALYTGDRITNLVEVAANDDAFSGVSFSKIAQAVHAGEVYRIVVDGFGGASGSVLLEYSFVATPVYQLTISTSTGGSVMPNSGEFAANSTVVLTAVADSNYEFVDWQGAVASTANPLSVLVNADMVLTARFRARAFTDGFESGGLSALPWASDGSDVPWMVQSNTVSFGQYAARSGIITNSQSSRLRLTFQSPGGAGSFDFRVSSESGWDFLEFSLNGQLQQRWSGEVNWTRYQFSVPAGAVTAEWRYVKDASTSAGLDAAFIDNVEVPLTPSVIQLVNLTGTGFQIQVQSQQVRVERSTDLVNWQTVSTLTVVNGTAQFVEPQPPASQVRFYRAVSP